MGRAATASKDGETSLKVRRRRLALTLAGAVLVAGLGLSPPLWLKSPQQMAADAQPPPLTTLTAPVERKVLRDTVVVRGEIASGRSFSVTPRGSDGIVTAVRVQRGDLVHEGMVVLEVSGRPLIVLKGDTPAYRDLRPGASGKDVAALQASLTALGHDPGEHNGVFGAGTKRALAALYSDLGYPTVPADPGDAERIDGLKRQVAAAQRAVEDAQDTVNLLAADPTATDADKAAADRALTRAKEDLAAAQEALARAEQMAGPMLPLSEYTFLPSFPARVDALTATLGEPVSEPLITLATGDPVVIASLTVAQKAFVAPGQSVDISGDDGLHAIGRVASVSDIPEKASVPSATSGYTLVVSPEPALDPINVGRQVLITIEIGTSEGEQLVVPIPALFAGADGKIYVRRRNAAGDEERIQVIPGMSAQGYVVITPVGATVSPGDLVVISGPAT